MIQLLSTHHLNALTTLFREVKIGLTSLGLDQWDDEYPQENDLAKDIERQEAYGYFIENELVGYAVFNQLFDVEYNDIQWLNTSDQFLVMHRLCVSPKHQGRGIAKEFIAFGETLCIDQRARSLRFDAFKQNPISGKLYQKLGYQILGEVTFRKGQFDCFEKIIY
ncbi:GNAT family N-acetyltransferase [Flammeovirga pacifica]|uniref:N-acetyltransferase domain-containing protein n=1 Tax=Flammeovirga pacifica TaxID=915059 RepID=A0A1S1Z3N1_FLAPC|nr:GNAT family N-acetyltransferase [Flammeovirga pacifica]OHX67880.1 hypothetical protein NH26_16815 [Flammeovirga pacifica]